MLIIEGTDLVGKTSLCTKLINHPMLSGYIYSHFTRLPAEFDYLWGYVDRMSRKVVQDRFHMSEIAYAKARGDEPRVTKERYRLIDAKLRLIGSYTVVITADESLISSRFKRPEMYDVKTILRANEEFRKIVQSGEYDVDCWISLDTVTPWVNDLYIKKIVDEYNDRQSQLEYFAKYRNVLPI